MKQSKFILLFIVSFVLITSSLQAQKTLLSIKGKIHCQGKGIAQVAVTDGVSIVETDSKGNYKLLASPASQYVYYSLPAGYESPIKEGIPVFFAPIQPTSKAQTIDFELTKAKLSQHKHTLIAWADPQVLELEEFDLLNKVIDDVNATLAALPADVPAHAISLGDNVFDRLPFLENYKKAISKIKIPFYQVIGNHDMDYNERSNELSDKTFTAAMGPSHFSYNVGNVHYVVLKDVFYYGYSYRYIGYIDEAQLAWLEQDLQKIKPGSTLIVSLHIPTVYGESETSPDYNYLIASSVMNRSALFKILAPFNTHILAGHSHTQWNTAISENISEHVHAAACAAWWQGELCTDGTPKGYTVYEIDGDKVSWYFKGVGFDKSEQFKLYPIGSDAQNPDYFIANVFNYDAAWKVEWLENGELKGEMTQYWSIDPAAQNLYKPGSSKKFSWLRAGSTHHLFKAKPVNANAKISVRVTDRFNNVYTKDLIISN